jgi:hypothetical protein
MLSRRPGSVQRIGLRDIIEATGTGVVASLIWGVANLECFGERITQDLMADLETQPEMRLLVDGERLLAVGRDVTQTIDGVFVGYDNRADATEFMQLGWGMICFESSLASVAVEIIDNSEFVVSSRSQEIVDRLEHRFPGAQGRSTPLWRHLS